MCALNEMAHPRLCELRLRSRAHWNRLLHLLMLRPLNLCDSSFSASFILRMMHGHDIAFFLQVAGCGCVCIFLHGNIP